MKKDNKKVLYESIMTSVAREVKKVLNEVEQRDFAKYEIVMSNGLDELEFMNYITTIRNHTDFLKMISEQINNYVFNPIFNYLATKNLKQIISYNIRYGKDMPTYHYELNGYTLNEAEDLFNDIFNIFKNGIQKCDNVKNISDSSRYSNYMVYADIIIPKSRRELRPKLYMRDKTLL